MPVSYLLLDAPASFAQLAAEPFVLYPGSPRHADHVIALFDAEGLSLKVAQWTNELQIAVGLVGTDIGYTPIVETTAVSPIILSRRLNDQSLGLSHCLRLAAELI